MKAILATGELATLGNVARASRVAMMAGADFIKTSTGKESVNAAMPVGIVMARMIRAYHAETGYAVGLKPAKFETSFNFTFPFKAEIEWNMAMTATMSADDQGIWITAWLAELPQSAAEVPRTALLRLLAQNDELGGGIFFAYISKVRKIVLECMIANEDITSASFKEDIRDLATKVSETQQFWNVAEWKQSPSSPSGSGKDSASDDNKSSADEKPAVLSGSGTKDAKPIKTATKDPSAGSSAAPKKK